MSFISNLMTMRIREGVSCTGKTTNCNKENGVFAGDFADFLRQGFIRFERLSKWDRRVVESFVFAEHVNNPNISVTDRSIFSGYTLPDVCVEDLLCNFHESTLWSVLKRVPIEIDLIKMSDVDKFTKALAERNDDRFPLSMDYLEHQQDGQMALFVELRKNGFNVELKFVEFNSDFHSHPIPFFSTTTTSEKCLKIPKKVIFIEGVSSCGKSAYVRSKYGICAGYSEVFDDECFGPLISRQGERDIGGFLEGIACDWILGRLADSGDKKEVLVGRSPTSVRLYALLSRGYWTFSEFRAAVRARLNAMGFSFESFLSRNCDVHFKIFIGEPHNDHEEKRFRHFKLENDVKSFALENVMFEEYYKCMVECFGEDRVELIPLMIGQKVGEKMASQWVQSVPQTFVYHMLDKTVRPPAYGTEESACFDLFCAEDTVVDRPSIVPLRIQLAIPKGFGVLLLGRSGLSSKGMCIRGGVIDSDYRGEIGVMVHPVEGPVIIQKNVAVCQGLFFEVNQFKFEESPEPFEQTSHTGFGSTDMPALKKASERIREAEKKCDDKEEAIDVDDNADNVEEIKK